MLGGGIPTIPTGGGEVKNFHILPDVYNDLIKELENQISLTKGMEEEEEIIENMKLIKSLSNDTHSEME